MSGLPCDFEPVVPVVSEPCPTSQLIAWGQLFSGVEYPLTLTLQCGAGTDVWHVLEDSISNNSLLRVSNQYEGVPVLVTFTRVSGAIPPASPLEDNEQVYVSIRVSGTTYYLNYSILNPINAAMLKVSSTSGTSENYIFSFNKSIRCCNVHIGFTPSIVTSTRMTLLVTDTKNRLDILHALSWPLFTAGTTNYPIGTTPIDWVWEPVIPASIATLQC